MLGAARAGREHRAEGGVPRKLSSDRARLGSKWFTSSRAWGRSIPGKAEWEKLPWVACRVRFP